MGDKEFIEWLYDGLDRALKDNKDFDYIKKLKEIIYNAETTRLAEDS